MTKPTLTVTTPVGTFTRSSYTEYTHVAVYTQEGGVQVYGAKLMKALRDGTSGKAEYGTVWSRSEANARKAKIPLKATLVGVFPVDSQPAPAPMVEEPAQVEETPVIEEPVVTPGELLTREDAVKLVNTGLLVRQVGKPLTHVVKLDKKDSTLARTLCGVPVKGASQNWLAIAADLTCKTCSQTLDKQARKAGLPTISEVAAPAAA